MNKKILCVIFALTAIFSVGCNTKGLSVDTLMHPPGAVGDKARIQALIDNAAGDGYTLKYPQAGSYRSAITMKDIDSDGTEEAVAFYLPQGDIATVHILLMDTVDGQWTAVGDFKSQSNAVESLSFCDLDGDGNTEIAVCWKTYNTSVNQLSLYVYENTSVRELTTDVTCSSLLVGDFTPHSGEELLLLSLFSTDKEACATLLDFNENKSELESLGSTALDPNVATYAQLQVGNIFENQTGAVIDGCTSGGEYNTQLLYFNTYFNSLERISFTENVPYNQALRSYAVMSQDINDDGIIEIPAVFKLSSTEELTDLAPAAEIYWCRQTSTGTVLLVSHQCVSLTYGFSLEISADWDGKYTALADFSKDELTFYRWNNDKLGDELLKIKIFDANSENDISDYSLICQSEDYIYTCNIPDGGNALYSNLEDIKEAFTLI